MIVERATNPQFVSNTYLVADGHGGPAFFIDAGGPVEGLIGAAERDGLTPTHLLLTHHHFDHVSEAGALRERWPDLRVLISAKERDLLDAARRAAGEASDAWGLQDVELIEAGERMSFGELEVRALHTPGHTAGMLSFLVQGPSGPGGVFTGDTLFKGSVGGVRAPGHTTYSELRDSIMGTLMELDPQTIIFPGHAEQTTVGVEWEQNPFIRLWRRLDPELGERCTALGEPARLILLAPDYDGGTKAWIRWEDGSDDIVPGSRIEREA